MTRGSLYVAPGGGVDFDTARAYLSGGASAQPVRAVVYETSSGSPTSLRAQSDAVTIAAGRPAGWVDFAFPSTVSIDGGSTYLLGLISGETTAQVTIYGSMTGAFFSGHDLDDDGAAATFAVAARSSLTLSLYAVPQPLTYSRRRPGTLRCRRARLRHPPRSDLGHLDLGRRSLHHQSDHTPRDAHPCRRRSAFRPTRCG